VKLEQDTHQENKAEALVRDEALETLKVRCAEKIAAAATAGSLQKNRHLAYLVWRWHQWTTPEVVPQWLSSLLQSPEGTLDLIRGFARVGRSISEGDRVARTHRFFPISDLEQLISVAALEAALPTVEGLTLTEDDRAILAAAREALERKRSGKSDGPFER
jgi:hypothetical protein